MTNFSLKPLQIGTQLFDFSRTYLVGIVNVTPDSFSDGGRYDNADAALRHIESLIAAGADMIDLGAESTRPDAEPVSAGEEIRRLSSIVKKYKTYFSTPLSIDTMKSDVADFCLSEGAHLINDISAFEADHKMPSVVARHHAAAIMMHMKGRPQGMQDNPTYQHIVQEIYSYFEDRILVAEHHGIDVLILDPGIGFGKTLGHNLTLLRHLETFQSLGHPLLIGTSRKSFIGKITGEDTPERLEGSISSNMIALQNGASFLRVHDVSAMKKAVAVADAILRTS